VVNRGRRLAHGNQAVRDSSRLCVEPEQGASSSDDGRGLSITQWVEWHMWFARKTRGPVAEVARRALDQNPPELIDPTVIRVHYGDPDDRARAYNQGYDDAWEHAREIEAVDVGRLNVRRLERAMGEAAGVLEAEMLYPSDAPTIAAEYAHLTRKKTP